MAQNFSDMLQEIVNKSYEDKVEAAKAVLGECYGILTGKGYDGKNATLILVTFLAASVASDGRFTGPERSMLNDIFHDDLEGIIKKIDGKAYDMMEQIVDSFESRDKSTFCLLAIYVLAVDDTINKDELSYLAKLMQ
jgi:hypothetical protein